MGEKAVNAGNLRFMGIFSDLRRKNIPFLRK